MPIYAHVCARMRSYASACVNDNDNEDDNENDNDNDDVNVNGSFRSFSLNEAIKKPDFDISSAESFFRSAGAMANLKPHRDSSLS